MKKEKYIHKITKKGKYSYAIILPKEIVKRYKWRDEQKVVIESYGKCKLKIYDWKRQK